MSSFGSFFRVTTFGESHCSAVGVVIDGDVQPQLSRRRPGQSKLTTARNEADAVQILSGVENGLTLGSPVAMMVANNDQRPADYASLADYPRPSHADFSYQAKYGVRASSGGGRSSARETIGRVAAGAVAEKWLRLRFGVEIVAWVSGVGDEEDHVCAAEHDTITRDQVEANAPVRCAHPDAVDRMARAVTAARGAKDSVGGCVTCVCRGVPAGWGEPVFDKLEAALAHAMLSIPATKGFEFGSGFQGCRMRGSEHNDAFVWRDGQMHTLTNNSGGVQGGITNGECVYFSVAFKPPATIGLPQTSCTFDGEQGVLEAHGRHDPCVVPRAVPIVEAMAALVLADAALCQLARESAKVPASPNTPAARVPIPREPVVSKPRSEEKEPLSLANVLCTVCVLGLFVVPFLLRSVPPK